MMCQQCLERPASVHLTQIINDEKKEIHLCEQCARKHKELTFDNGFTFASPFSIHNFLAGFLGNGFGYHIQPQERSTMPACDFCNMTYEQFARSGKLGCGHCYDVFGSTLEPVFKKMHGNTYHHGKLPQRAGGMIKAQREIKGLKLQLNKAVHNEEYERAAQVRDKIRELEAQLKEDI